MAAMIHSPAVIPRVCAQAERRYYAVVQIGRLFIAHLRPFVAALLMLAAACADHGTPEDIFCIQRSPGRQQAAFIAYDLPDVYEACQEAYSPREAQWGFDRIPPCNCATACPDGFSPSDPRCLYFAEASAGQRVRGACTEAEAEAERGEGCLVKVWPMYTCDWALVRSVAPHVQPTTQWLWWSCETGERWVPVGPGEL
jgi:hypothetical protein